MLTIAKLHIQLAQLQKQPGMTVALFQRLKVANPRFLEAPKPPVEPGP